MHRIRTVLGVLIVLLLAGTSAAVMMHVPYFSQCDSRWSGDRLGGDGQAVCGSGCALTSAAMVAAYYGVKTDPERLNDAIGCLGCADMSVTFGGDDDLPVVGGWDGDSGDNIGVYRSRTGEFFMDATVPDVSASKTIYVDDDFDDDPSEHEWDTIQEGVDDAADGDTVIVYAGEYVENVRVGKSMTLRGEGADVVTVRARPEYHYVFEVTADWVTISGFTATEATDRYQYRGAGFYLYYVEHCNIYDNNASNNSRGICLSCSSNNTLTNNNAPNKEVGIYLSGSSDNTLRSNTMKNNVCGIDLYSSSNNMLKHNTMFANTRNFGVYGDSPYHYTQNMDASNTVDGKPIYYWVDRQDAVIPSDAGYVGVVNSTNITIRDLTLMNNYHGVLCAYTNDSRIKNVDAPNNEYGIYLRESSSNVITGNNASCNRWYGICMDSSNNNTLSGNTALGNLDGIFLWYSSNNTLQNNIMSGNICNFGVWGGSLSDYIQNIDMSNTVDGNPIYYWVDQKDVQIPSDAGFVGVVNSTNTTVRDLTLTNNAQGVLFAYSANSRIENVTTSNNSVGIYLDSSSNNILQNNNMSNNVCGIHLYRSSNYNTLTNNTANFNGGKGVYLGDSSNNMLQNNTANSNDEGIYLSGSCNNTVSRNTVNSNDGSGIRLISLNNNILSGNTANSNNWCGISIEDSGNNTIFHHNNLINNTFYNAYDGSTNQWDFGSAGNYWSDYNGTDPDGNGIGNDPHQIPGGNSTDRFPLMQPWSESPQQLGDLNYDGEITPADAVIALAIAVGSHPCDAAMLALADVSGDGQVTSLDALMILKAAGGKIEL